MGISQELLRFKSCLNRMIMPVLMILLSVLLLALSPISESYSDPEIPSGYWKILDDDSGEMRSVVEFYMNGDKLHARIKELREGAEDAVCSECPGELDDKKLLGMDLIWDLSWDGSRWSGGSIIDVDEGEIYSCRINSFDDETIDVRGYMGRPFLGRTVTWHRKK